jgi:hypothetical protein
MLVGLGAASAPHRSALGYACRMNQLRPLECPVCGGSHVTPATRVKQMNADIGLHAVFEGGDGTAGFAVTRCRACLDCGHVLLFLSDKQLGDLRQKITGLLPVPPHPQD